MIEVNHYEAAILLGDGRLETPRIYKGVILPLPRIIATLQRNMIKMEDKNERRKF